MKPKIAVDIDSTLYDFETAAREGFLKLAQEDGDKSYLKGHYVAWTEWRSPADVCGVGPWLEVIAMCHEPEFILSREPYAGAVDTLVALHEAGYPLMYVSTRNPESAAATREWLVNKGFPCYEGVEVRCQMEDKKPHLAECQYLIDDRPRTLVDFVYERDWQGGQRKAFSLLTSYNRALTDIPNIYLAASWSGVKNFLVEKSLLDG